MEKVLRNLATLNCPWNCPHGRPTLMKLVSFKKWINITKVRIARLGPRSRSPLRCRTSCTVWMGSAAKVPDSVKREETSKSTYYPDPNCWRNSSLYCPENIMTHSTSDSLFSLSNPCSAHSYRENCEALCWKNYCFLFHATIWSSRNHSPTLYGCSMMKMSETAKLLIYRCCSWSNAFGLL